MQKMLYNDNVLSRISVPKARKIDLEIAFYVEPEDAVKDIVKEIFG